MIKFRWPISVGALVFVLVCARAEDRPVEQELKKMSEAIQQ